MSKQCSEGNEHIPLGRMSDTAAYSARIQEAMRYDKLGSSNYPIVLTIMRAVSQGCTEEKLKVEQHSTVNVLTNQPPDKTTLHADAANQDEQTMACFKYLALWPW
jgi:hypothetical protein